MQPEIQEKKLRTRDRLIFGILLPAFNLLLLLLEVETRKSCFLCGMILPTIVFIGAIAYQSGLWDNLT